MDVWIIAHRVPYNCHTKDALEMRNGRLFQSLIDSKEFLGRQHAVKSNNLSFVGHGHAQFDPETSAWLKNCDSCS